MDNRIQVSVFWFRRDLAVHVLRRLSMTPYKSLLLLSISSNHRASPEKTIMTFFMIDNEQLAICHCEERSNLIDLR
ncbi:MAG TPA: hypothetical protein VGI43_15535 [Mucilaginibacter sp.]